MVVTRWSGDSGTMSRNGDRYHLCTHVPVHAVQRFLSSGQSPQQQGHLEPAGCGVREGEGRGKAEGERREHGPEQYGCKVPSLVLCQIQQCTPHAINKNMLYETN